MKQGSLAFLHGLSDEEKLLAANISDKIFAAEEKARTGFTFFLSEAGAEIARQVVSAYSFERYLFFGGYEGAERMMLGLFSPYEEVKKESFPITAVTFSYRERYKLSHRDFLGTLMGADLARGTVGDILAGDGKACVFLTDTAADFVLDNISKVGRVGVKLTKGFDGTVIPKREFEKIKGTVASLRADCIVALAARCSRAKADELIAAGMVSVKGRTVTQGSEKIEAWSTFSVRGHGKYVLSDIGNSTKKERIFLEIMKFV